MPGGPDVVLTRPVTTSLLVMVIVCFVDYAISLATGSQAQHFELTSAIVAQILSIPNMLCGLGSDGQQNYLYGYYSSVEAYLAKTNMAANGT